MLQQCSTWKDCFTFLSDSTAWASNLWSETIHFLTWITAQAKFSCLQSCWLKLCIWQWFGILAIIMLIPNSSSEGQIRMHHIFHVIWLFTCSIHRSMYEVARQSGSVSDSVQKLEKVKQICKIVCFYLWLFGSCYTCVCDWLGIGNTYLGDWRVFGFLRSCSPNIMWLYLKQVQSSETNA